MRIPQHETCLLPGTWMIDGFTVVRQNTGRQWAIYGPCDEFGMARNLGAARRTIRAVTDPHTNSTRIGDGRYAEGGDCTECGVKWPCPTEVRRRDFIAGTCETFL